MESETNPYKLCSPKRTKKPCPRDPEYEPRFWANGPFNGTWAQNLGWKSGPQKQGGCIHSKHVKKTKTDQACSSAQQAAVGQGNLPMSTGMGLGWSYACRRQEAGQLCMAEL